MEGNIKILYKKEEQVYHDEEIEDKLEGVEEEEAER